MPGASLGLASNFSFSTRAVLTKRLKRSSPSAEAATSDLVLFYHVSRLGLWLVGPVTLLLEGWSLPAQLLRSENAGRLLLLLLANGGAHAAYNGISYVVLSRVSVATHAVLNIVRRVLVISAAAALFGTPVSSLNRVGLVLTVAGLWLFSRSKAMGAGGELGAGGRGQ